MNLTREKTFFIWSTIGPLLALATVLLMLYQSTPLTPYLGLVMVLGIPISWYFKKWGVILTSFILTFLVFFNVQAITGNLFWHIGIIASIILTLFVASNSYEEAMELVEEFSGTSTSTAETLEQYKAELEAAQFKYQSEIHQLQKKIESYTHEIKVEQEKALLLNEDADKAHQEAQQYKLEWERAKQDLDIIRGEYESKSIKEEHLLQESLEQRQEILQLRDQLYEAQQELKNSTLVTSSETKEDSESITTLKEMFNKSEQDLFNTQFRLESALEDYREQEKELIKLQNAENVHKKVQHEMSEQIDILKREKDLLEKTLNKLQVEAERYIDVKAEKEHLEKVVHQLTEDRRQLQEVIGDQQREMNNAIAFKEEKEKLELALKQIQEELTQKNNTTHESTLTESTDSAIIQERAYRKRAESMYLQLKEQFNQKAEILDETRRELFVTQEKLLQIQRTVKEKDQFSPNPEVQALLRYLVKMQRWVDHRIKSYDSEIDSLHEIISKLS